MNADIESVAKVEHDFQLLCEALQGLSDRQISVFLAKLSLVLCDLIDDRSILKQAVARAKMNLPGG